MDRLVYPPIHVQMLDMMELARANGFRVKRWKLTGESVHKLAAELFQPDPKESLSVFGIPVMRIDAANAQQF